MVVITRYRGLRIFVCLHFTKFLSICDALLDMLLVDIYWISRYVSIIYFLQHISVGFATPVVCRVILTAVHAPDLIISGVSWAVFG